MADAVVMPKLGNSVDSCILVSWKKGVGDQVAAGEALCEIETDKALMEIESAVSGSLLALFFAEGEEIPVFTNIAAIGQPGESFETLRPALARQNAPSEPPASAIPPESRPSSVPHQEPAALRSEHTRAPHTPAGFSPRATRLALRQNIAIDALSGSGPRGRIIERDVLAAIEQQPTVTPLAKRMLAQGQFAAPAQGTGSRGRILAADLSPSAVPHPPPTALPVEPEADASPAQEAGEFETVPVQGVRRVIARRMLESLQTSAQLTLNSSADAQALLAYRQRLKASAEASGLQQVTINDLILFTVSRTLKRHSELNALFKDDVIYQYNNVNLGFAVDTARGLMAPVIHDAAALSLLQIGREARRLASACQDGAITAAEMENGTFTVTNLGSAGVESFTPILNPPQVAILGVGSINLKPVEIDGELQFRKHIGLSLTINHQVIDGAPAARFLQALARGLAEVDLLLAL